MQCTTAFTNLKHETCHAAHHHHDGTHVIGKHGKNGPFRETGVQARIAAINSGNPKLGVASYLFGGSQNIL